MTGACNSPSGRLLEGDVNEVRNNIVVDLPNEDNGISLSSSLQGIELKVSQAFPVVHGFKPRYFGSEGSLDTLNPDDITLVMRGPQWAAVLDDRPNVCLEQ